MTPPENRAVAYNKPTAKLHAAAQDVCLGFPEAVEKETWGHPTFRVRDKIFASFGQNEEDDAASLTLKSPTGEQALLLATGGPFFYPKYVGSSGWIGVYVNATTDWEEIRELVEDSYRMTAPKRLVDLLE